MDRRIVILGFMGCGKTTVAKELARQLECGFVDLDTFIIEHRERSPAEIITADGESAFRQVESGALNDALTLSDARIIALGGGTWTVPANRTLIALHDCMTIWLDAPFSLCWERIISSRQTARPLAPNREIARRRYQDRRAVYSLSSETIPITISDSIETIVKKLLIMIGPTPTGALPEL